MTNTTEKTLSDLIHSAAVLHGMAQGLEILMDDGSSKARNAIYSLADAIENAAEELSNNLDAWENTHSRTLREAGLGSALCQSYAGAGQ